MFHLKYPRFHGFFAWDELGCMSRALGFPVDLFKNNLSHEINAEENGLVHKELYKVLDYKLLFKSLHQTINHHSADWNTCVIRGAISVLDHRAVTFEDLYNIRVAYQAYEAGDMKGLMINQHTILRTLKLCGKTISPMKLMHRLKHSKDDFEEHGRIQLYEFLDLILWCDVYESYTTVDHPGCDKENKLFKLTDFEKLLSHHDQRLASVLDKQYLKEEWDFGHEKLGNRSKFTSPPVICGDARVELVRSQRESYRHLRAEVGSSQTMVYRVKSGYIRQRPLTAPNLGPYQQKDEASEMESIRTQTLQQKMENLLKAAVHQNAAGNKVVVDTSDRPIPVEFKRCQTPKIVSDTELEETEQKVKELMFNIETEKGRGYIMTETAIEYYIPKYKEKWLEKQNQEPSPAPIKKKMKSAPSVSTVSKEEIAHSLAYPDHRIPPSHAKRCDARFRGWQAVRSKKGPHYILASPYFSNTPRGQVERKAHIHSLHQVRKVRSDLLFRYTKKDEVESRPITAPAAMEDQGKTKLAPKSPGTSSGYWSLEGKMTRETSNISAKSAFDQLMVSDIKSGHDPVTEVERSPSPGPAEESTVDDVRYVESQKEEAILQSKDYQFESPNHVVEEEIVDMKTGERMELETSSRHGSIPSPSVEIQGQRTGSGSRSGSGSGSEESANFTEIVRAKSAEDKRTVRDKDSSAVTEEQKPRTKSASGMSRPGIAYHELAPMPHMEHRKPRTVLVGNIGQISLLENIREAPFWEEMCVKDRSSDEESSSDESSDTQSISTEKKSRSRSQKKKRPKHTSPENKILSMIIAEEKSRKKKERKLLTPTMENVLSSPRRSIRCSPSSHKSASSVKDDNTSAEPTSDREPKIPDDTPAQEMDIVTAQNTSSTEHESENKMLSPVEKLPSPVVTEQILEMPVKQEEQAKTSSGKVKHVVIVGKDENIDSPRSRRGVNKYERLVKRVDGEISDRLSKRLLSKDSCWMKKVPAVK